MRPCQKAKQNINQQKQTNKKHEQGMSEGRFSPPTKAVTIQLQTFMLRALLLPAQCTDLHPSRLPGSSRALASLMGADTIQKPQYTSPSHIVLHSTSDFAHDSNQLVPILIQIIFFPLLVTGSKYVTTAIRDSGTSLFRSGFSRSPRLPLGCGFQNLCLNHLPLGL